MTFNLAHSAHLIAPPKDCTTDAHQSYGSL